MQRTNSTTWSVADPITATRLNAFNSDLDTLFKELSNENVTATYDIQGQLSSLVDSENSITINFDWSQWNSATVKLMIQKAGDPKKYTITYDANGFPATCVYA